MDVFHFVGARGLFTIENIKKGLSETLINLSIGSDFGQLAWASWKALKYLERF